MDIGVDTQQGADTYNVEIWLPSETDENYSSLKRTSEKVKDALMEENEKENKSEKGNEKVALVPKEYSSRDDVVNVSTDPAAKVVAAISFSEDFAKKYHFDEEQRKENGNVAVLAMMGGILPVGKNFFRMGFSVETIAGILGDHVIHDRQVSHVFLIRVDNKLGDRFEEEFSRKIESQKCSLDILSIDADVKKATIGVLNENVRTNNTTTTTFAESVKEAADEKKSSSVEHVISQWLSGRIRSRPDEGLKSVVIYGYWEGYWDFVKEVLRCEDFRDDEDWLYVESNYPLLTPILYNKQSGSDLTNIVEIKEADKLNVKDSESDRIQEDFGQIPSEEKNDDGKIKIDLNPSDTKGSREEYDTQVTGVKTKGFKDKTKKLTEDVHVQGLGRVRCFTGKLVEKENSFITFAKETVRLLRAAIRYAQDKLEKEKKSDDIIPYIRERICEFLVRSKFYASEHLGSFFFRKDGELFFPLYLYNGKLERQRIVRESCCNDVEFTKEAIADQLLRLSDSLNKITGANIIPRNLEIKKDTKVANVFRQFSEMIAKISNGIEIDFVSNYPDTKRIFYTWPEPTEGGGNESFPHVSIFDEASKIVKGVIQINLNDFDLEDNNAYRAYLVYGDKISTLKEWANKHKDASKKDASKSEPPSVRAVVFAKSRIRIKAGQVDEGKNYKDNSLDAISKFLSDFEEYWKSMAKSNANFLYFIPEYISEGNDPEGKNSLTKKGVGGWSGGIVITTRYKLSLFDLQIIENMVSRIFSVLKICIAEHDALLSNIKSAIGSIMSRNGSHNIGSHVLAALSHNVGTLPDDRVLYQYIQQRMDYIATVTTDFPTWTQPTMFVADMMKTFLSQRHLLDHIVESEGLHAFQFQNPNMTDEEWSDQKNCVRIHIRRKEGQKYKELIDYTKRDAKVSLQDSSEEYDISLAIPGGIIGEHAFYTILENIIRNAAKHSWSTIKQRQIRQNEIELQYNNLELFIDFEEKDDEVKFNVYAKLPMAQVVVEKSSADDELCQKVIASEKLIKWTKKFDDMGVVKAKEENGFKELPDYEQEQVKLHLTNLKDEPLKKWVDRYDKQGGLTSDEQKKFDSLAIHHKQQVMLARPFIDSQGALRRENWGMAEMKISAGYLAGESIEAIGGIGDKKGSNEIITPRIKSEKVKRKCLESGEKVTEIEVEELYLGYEFSIAKPKEILIIVAEELNREGKDDGWGRENIRNELKNHGIFVKTVSEIKQEKRLNYRYVVHYNARELFDKNYHVKDDVLLPFRMLSGADIKDERLKRFIPTIQIDELKKCFEENAKASKNEIQKLVYNAYLKHLLGQIGIAEQRIGLLVSINENEKAGGNSLISDADILELMLEQNFAVCVDQYKAFAANEDNRKIIKCLESIRHKSSAKDKVIKFKHFSNKTIRELIAQRMCDWAEKPNDSWNSIVEHLRKKYFVSDAERESETSNELRPSSNKTSDDFAASVNSLLQKHPIDDFIRYVESVFENTKKLFKQYEEQIVTLPAGYKVDIRNSGDEGRNETDSSLGVKIQYKASDVEKDTDGLSWIAYRRHDCSLSVNKKAKVEYVEPLSGTQTYLSQLAKVKNDLGLQMRLIENGLMRILVLDERVAKFLREHQKEVGPHYKAMNINVIDHEWVVAGGKNPPEGFYEKFTSKHKKALKSFVKPQESNKSGDGQNESTGENSDSSLTQLDDVDILIVHQGILDKWYPEFKNPNDMSKLLEGLKKLVKYVVVTTGRGTPENIPEEAHLLPFAVVESTLFKKYPEKLILTDTIMNVLPVGKKNDNSGGQK